MSNRPQNSLSNTDNRLASARCRLAHFCENVIPSLSENWMRHSLALDHLEAFYAVPLKSPDSTGEFGCGPAAFAALGALPPEEVSSYFPNSTDRAWTNRREMEKALESFGWRYTRLTGTWPQLGLCLVHWRGPWTKRGFPAAVMPHTHWVAVIAEYVFDVNWHGWLPRQNWEEVVVPDLIRRHPYAEGWDPLCTVRIFVYVQSLEQPALLLSAAVPKAISQSIGCRLHEFTHFIALKRMSLGKRRLACLDLSAMTPFAQARWGGFRRKRPHQKGSPSLTTFSDRLPGGN